MSEDKQQAWETWQLLGSRPDHMYRRDRRAHGDSMSLKVYGDVNTRPEKQEKLHPISSSICICFAYKSHLPAPLRFSCSWPLSLVSQGLAQKKEVTAGMCNSGNLMQGRAYHGDWYGHQQAPVHLKTGGTQGASNDPRPLSPPPCHSLHSYSSVLQFPFGWAQLMGSLRQSRRQGQSPEIQSRAGQGGMNLRAVRPKVQQTS